MKVLIFSPEKPYTGAESIATGKLMRAMINSDWKVDLIFHDLELIYTSSTDTFNILNNCYGIKNKFIKKCGTLFKKIPVLQKIYLLDSFFWIIRAVLLALKLNKKRKYDLVFSRIMPQYGHLPAYLFSRLKKKNWIANWSDPLPIRNSPFPYGQGAESKMVFWQSFYMNTIIKYAHKHTFPSVRLMKYYHSYLPRMIGKSIALPHVILEETTLTTESKRENEKLIITHAGGFRLRDPSNLILAVHDLIKKEKIENNFVFRFIGNIEPYIQELITRLELGQLFFLEGVKPYEETLNIIKESDIMLIVEAPLAEGIFLPSKIMDCLQYNKPLFAVSPKHGVINDLLKTYGGGLAANVTSVLSIQNTLLQILNDSEQIQKKINVYNTARIKELFSETRVLNKLHNTIQEFGENA
jgi:hypothetical protein